MLRESIWTARLRNTLAAMITTAILILVSASVAHADGDLLHERVRPAHPPSAPHVGAPSSGPSGDPMPTTPVPPRRMPRGNWTPGKAGGDDSCEPSATWLDNLRRLLHLVRAGD
jgi:hypothetical protein